MCLLQVTGVVGRAETLSSVFFLAAFILYTKSTKRRHVTGINTWNKYTNFYNRTQKFINVYAKSNHWTQSRASSVHISSRVHFISILSWTCPFKGPFCKRIPTLKFALRVLFLQSNLSLTYLIINLHFKVVT
jgi:hypothetical protein